MKRIAFVFASLTSLVVADTITVNTAADSGLVGGDISLRSAIASASNGDTIDFDSGLNGSTIQLDSAQLNITNLAVTIDASALDQGISISGVKTGAGRFRVLQIGGTSDVTLRNLTITNGGTTGSGGGLLLAGGNLTMTDCSVTNCSADFNGGGLYFNVDVTATLDRCSITENASSITVGLGGGAFVGGATSLSINNSLISGNAGFVGGGVFISNASPSFTNCTIQGNAGEGIRNDLGSDSQIQNCIFWGNTAPSGTTAAQQVHNVDYPLAPSDNSNPTISNSLIEGASGPTSFSDGNAVTWGTGNLDGTLLANNPKFLSAISSASAPHSGGDLRLFQGSNALDSGDNGSTSGSFDLLNEDRVQNLIVDMGAFEGSVATFAGIYPSLSPTEDENENGITNFREYSMGFDPNSTANDSILPTVSSEGGFSVLKAYQRSNALDVTFLLETSVTIDLWGPMIQGVHYTLSTDMSDSPERTLVSLQLIDTEPWRFYRQGFQVVE